MDLKIFLGLPWGYANRRHEIGRFWYRTSRQGRLFGHFKPSQPYGTFVLYNNVSNNAISLLWLIHSLTKRAHSPVDGWFTSLSIYWFDKFFSTTKMLNEISFILLVSGSMESSVLFKCIRSEIAGGRRLQHGGACDEVFVRSANGSSRPLFICGRMVSTKVIPVVLVCEDRRPPEVSLHSCTTFRLELSRTLSYYYWQFRHWQIFRHMKDAQVGRVERRIRRWFAAWNWQFFCTI